MNYQSLLLCMLAAVGPLTVTTDQSRTLEQLRQNYQRARAEAAKVDRPKNGSPDFREQLSDWSAATRTQREAAELLVPALLKHWSILPDDSDDLATVEEEIKAVFADMTGKPLTVRNSKARSFFAGELMDLLIEFKLARERASLLVNLTEPFAGVRINDKAALVGKPTEPTGWIVQDAHALALLRAGRIEDARREIELLIKKVTINVEHGRIPKMKVNYRDGKRSQQSLRREYLLHGALIDAHGGNQERASSLLSDALAIEDDQNIQKHQKQLVDEIKTVLDSTYFRCMRSIMPDNSRRVSKILLIAGLFCLAVGLMPGRSKYRDRQTNAQVTEWKLGAFSPLWSRTFRETPEGHNVENGFHLLSWSWLPVGIGVVLLELRRKNFLKRNEMPVESVSLSSSEST